MSGVYLLKDNTQVSDVIKKFINEIKTKFSITIRVLHTILKKKSLFFMHLMVFYTR